MTPEITRVDGKIVRVRPKKPLFRIKISRQVVLAGCAALLVWTLVGVAAWRLSQGILGPRAPALRDESVYQDSQAEFRFLAPNGWTQWSRTVYLPGPANRETQLVEYKKMTTDQPAGFEVTYADIPPSTDLGAYLAGASLGQARWNPTAPATPLTVSGVEANRFMFSAGNVPDLMTKEVVVFRRGDRVFFFTGIFLSSDSESRQQIGRTVESVVWKN